MQTIETHEQLRNAGPGEYRVTGEAEEFLQRVAHLGGFEQWRGISRCGYLGWHAYMAGPCFDTMERAIARRDYLDSKGVQWEAVR